MEYNLHRLTKIAAEMRLELLRMFSYGKAHHFGGSFSSIDILAALYFYKMNYSLENWNKKDRDRFIMSKGHSVPAQYVALAMLGLYSKEELQTIKQLGSVFQGHPDMRKTKGIEAPTGSLGQGLSFANGIALAARADKLDFDVFVLMGDGELQEGQVWEAAMTTSHYKLDHVCVIIDRNRFQSQGNTEMLKSLEPLTDKFDSFGWRTVEIDGHDMYSICEALDLTDTKDGKPLAIIANTIKGKGIRFMENTYKYHNYNITEEEYRVAMEELVRTINTLEKGNN